MGSGIVRMNQGLEALATTLKGELRAWFDQPNEVSIRLQELQEQIDAMKGVIGARAASDASRALSGSKRTIQANRQREAADVIAAACREFGVILDAKAPLKRTPRKKGKKPTPPADASHVVSDSPETNTQ